MSRSFKAGFVTDNKGTGAKKRHAARVHRHNENQNLYMMGIDYEPLPSKAYTNQYDICDYRFVDAEATRK